MEKIRWAICGLGRISEVFLAASKLVDGMEIVACASSDKARAIAFRDKHNLKYAYTYDELYASREVDAAYVCTNMSIHCPNTLSILANKIPVLCEKAFSLSAAQTQAMTAAAQANDTLLMEAMWTRFLPATCAVRQLIADGSLGAVTKIGGVFSFDGRRSTADSNRLFSKAAGGGSLLDVGVYLISYIYGILGAPAKLTAQGKTQAGIDLDCRMNFEYPAVQAAAYCSVTDEQKCYINITCQKGKIHIPDFCSATAFEVVTEDGKTTPYRFEDVPGFVYQIKHFNGLLRANQKESPLHTLSDTQEVMKLITEAHRQLGVTFDCQL